MQTDKNTEAPAGRPRWLRYFRKFLVVVLCLAGVLLLTLYFAEDQINEFVRTEITSSIQSLSSAHAGGREFKVDLDTVDFDLLGSWLKLSGLQARSFPGPAATENKRRRVLEGSSDSPEVMLAELQARLQGKDAAEKHRITKQFALNNDVFTLAVDSVYLKGIPWGFLLFGSALEIESFEVYGPRLQGSVYTSDVFAALSAPDSSANDKPQAAANQANQKSSEEGSSQSGSAFESLFSGGSPRFRITNSGGSPLRDNYPYSRAEKAQSDLDSIAHESALIDVDVIKVIDLSINLLDKSQIDGEGYLKLAESSLHLEKIAMYPRNNGPIISLSNVDITGNGIARKPAAGDYSFKVARLKFNAADAALGLDSLEYGLAISDSAFFAKQKYRADIFDFSSTGIKALGLDVNALLDGEILALKTVKLEGAGFDILSDKRKSVDPSSSAASMPLEVLHNFPIELNIDSIQIRDMLLTYGERQPGWSVPASLFWENVHADLTGLSTDLRSSSELEIVLIAAGKFMGEARMHIDLTMPNDDAGELSFDCQGGLEAMALTPLNQFLSKSELIRIDSGRTLGAEFTMSVRDGVAGGTVDARYHNLEMTLLDREDLEQGDLIKRFKGFLARNFVINSKNMPGENGTIRTGTIKNTLEFDQTFPSFLWISVRSGLSELLGIG